MLDQHLYSLESGTGTTTTPCYRSSTLKIPAILAKVQVGGYNKYARTLRMWLCMKWHGCMVYTEFVLRQQQFHVGPAMPALQAHHFDGYSEMHYKKLVTHVESHASAVRLLESG